MVIVRGGGFTTSNSGWKAVWDAPSPNVRVNENGPTAAGVPAIEPVDEFRFKPGGRVPELIEYVYGGVPRAPLQFAV